jgi:streptomycin 6-kinase
VQRGGGRGWLAIDPKGIAGPREFDYLNLFTNWTLDEATRCFDARLRVVTSAAQIERDHLLRWIAAWGALSGIWHLENGNEEKAALPHAISALALDRLKR